MPRDPLIALARLRSLDVLAAQRRLAQARAALATEQDTAATTAAMLRDERPDALPATYGAFLAGLMEVRQVQAAAIARAEAMLEAERSGLAEARGREKSLELLRDRRAAGRRQKAERRGQALLDEAVRQGHA